MNQLNAQDQEKVKKIISYLSPIIEATRESVIKIDLQDIDNDNNSIFTSKVGGAPYLPPNTRMNKRFTRHKMGFLWQINFEEVPKDATISPLLPQKGILQFWINITDDIYGVNYDDLLNTENGKLVYYENIDKSVTLKDITKRYNLYLEDVAEKYSWHLEEYPIDITQGLKMNFQTETECLTPYSPQFDDLFREAFFKLFDVQWHEASGEEFRRRLDINSEVEDAFGELFPYKIGGRYRVKQDDSYKKYPEYDQLIFYLESDYLIREPNNDIMFGDAGVAYWLMRKEDLINKDFSKYLYNVDH
ncbi:DUF1963 domain-containing protein [Macrococcoides canis]|uniref:DUF1963 domain-containing protein n=1 Tax=Macrococcoides canis TaxID=1855823 RepID=UPI0020B8DD0D|nr:DUF1963 domain-containing protein [Macrococcus canis]UTH03521.1 DUF1963 domain-containing protein [Macrococcus canis]